jgi:hypothetical protein
VDDSYVTVVLIRWHDLVLLCFALSVFELAAVGFPIISLFLILLWILVVPRLLFFVEELDILDRHAASPFVSR